MIGDPTELLMFLEAEASKHRRKHDKGGWAWRKGVEFFIAPETRCSFCGQTFEANRAYVLDNLNHLVPKQWRLATGEKVKMGNKMYHPHAFHNNGGVCLNEADTLPQLVFNSINTAPNYHAQEYFWDIGHHCPKTENKKCPWCEKNVPTFALKHAFAYRYMCSMECVEDARKTLCAMCFNDRKGHDENPDGFGPYCKDCTTIVADRVTMEDELEEDGDPDDDE